MVGEWTYRRRRRISARVLDMVGRDLGGLGVEEGEEGFRKGDFGGGHFGGWAAMRSEKRLCARC